MSKSHPASPTLSWLDRFSLIGGQPADESHHGLLIISVHTFIFCGPPNNTQRPRRLAPIASFCLRLSAVTRHTSLLKNSLHSPVSAIAILALGKIPQPHDPPNRLFLPSQKVRFSMLHMMLLVTATTAGMGIFTTFPNPVATVWYYTLLGVSVPSFIRAPEEWDFWLPSVMNALLIAWIPLQPPSSMNGLLDFINFGSTPWFFCYSILCALVSIPLLIGSAWQRQNQNTFSYILFVYQFISTLPGLYLILMLILFSSSSLLSSISLFLENLSQNLAI